MKQFENIFLTHTGLALKRFKMIPNSVYNNYSSQHFYKYSLYKYFFEKRIKLEENVMYVSIHNHWSTGYHHWVVESLVRALSIAKHERAGLTLLLPEKYPKFAFDSILPLNFQQVVTIPDKACVKVKNIVIPPNPSYKVFKPEDISSLREFYFDSYGIEKDRNSGRKIYVSRANSKLRKVENEKCVIELMRSYGFEIVRAEDLTFHEQVKLFSETCCLVSIHGAALTNMVFMPAGAVVLEFFRELIDEEPAKNTCFDLLAKATGISFSSLFCARDLGATVHPDRANLTVNIVALKEWLNHTFES